MSICNNCGGEMRTADGCDTQYVVISGQELERIRFGSETRGGHQFAPRLDGTVPYADQNNRCHDCGVAVGQFHHPGCDVDECPRCRFQAISCGCEVKS